MTTATFIAPDARYRLIVACHEGVWSAEIRADNGLIGRRVEGFDPDQVVGEACLAAQMQSGDTMAELAADFDDSQEEGTFAAECMGFAIMPTHAEPLAVVPCGREFIGTRYRTRFEAQARINEFNARGDHS